jgi:serine/threonine-protein kinase RsbW
VLRVKNGPLTGPILTRVVAMMLARTSCPVDRLDDAMVICDALAAHAGEHAEDGLVQFTVLTHADGLQLRVGALGRGSAQRLAAATAVPGVGEVLKSIADDVRVEPSPSGDAEELVLDLAFAVRPSPK